MEVVQLITLVERTKVIATVMHNVWQVMSVELITAGAHLEKQDFMIVA